MEKNTGVIVKDIIKLVDTVGDRRQDLLAVEEPLEIRVVFGENGIVVSKPISVTMRTPGNDDSLGIGFLFTEGVIKEHKTIEKVEVNGSENTVHIYFKNDFIPELQHAERNFYTTSSCGVCGKSSIEAIKTSSCFTNLKDELIIPAGTLYNLPDLLRTEQAIFESTGGLHASALFDIEGNFIMMMEDVGRHNALDKLIGKAFMKERLPLTHSVLLLSGRASFELVQKAAMAGIKIIAAVGAPSSLAVELAKENDITLIGFLRSNKCNIYTGEKRVHFN